MGNILHKRKQIVIGGGGSIAGLISQGTKSSDFTAVANSIYEITANCKMTLPSSPLTNDKAGFLLSSTVNFDIFSTDKINGSYLATDYAKRVTQPYVIGILTYSGSTNGWVWDSYFNSYINDAYTGAGFAFTYSSTSNLNGVVNHLGLVNNVYTNNPYPTYIDITGGVTTVGHATPNISNHSYLFDKATTNSIGLTGITNTSSDCGPKLTFNGGNLIKPTTIAVYIKNEGLGSSTNLFLQADGIKVDGSVENIGEVVATPARWFLFTYTGQSYFKTLYFHAPSLYYARPSEIEIWGLYQ